MSKSRARYLAELLTSDGLVKVTTSALAGADGVIDLEVLPTIPNSQLEHSSISIAGHTLSLGGSLSLDTSDITEHASYLYYTDARVRGALSVSGSLAYNSSTGVISYTTPTTIASLSNHDTDDLSEGVTNLYWTTARGNSNFDTRLATKTTSDLSEGTNLYYTDARVASYLTTNSYATQGYVNTAVSNLVDSAPATLDTLNELAAALGDDPNFATTVTNSIGTKWTQDNTKISNWNTAYGWGNHALAGYLASSSYTAADVLTKIKTVDGSGSGLDADLLDGVQGSSYLRSDANDTATGAITFQNSSDVQIYLNGNGTSWAGIAFTDTGGTDYLWFNGANGTFSLGGGGSNVAGKKLHVDGGLSVGSSSDGTATPSEGIYSQGQISVAGSTVWHAGNDGSGSGLDADLLDGVQGSGYQTRLLQQSSRNLVLATGTTGAGGLFLESSSGQFIFQLYGDQSQYGFLASEWGSWDIKKTPGGNMVLNNSDSNIVWHAGNDGSGSGLDADLLDGQQGTYYQPASTALTTSTTFSGDVSGTYNAIVVANDSHTHAFNNLTGKTSGTGDYATTGDIVSGKGSGGVALTINDGKGNANVTFNHQNGNPEQDGNAARIEVNTDSTSGASMYFELKSNVSNGVNVNLTPIMRLTETEIKAESGKVFSGNGSSLTNVDADLLDGLNSAENGSNVILKTASNGYLNISNWIQIGATTGLYNSGGHYFYPDATYGWRLRNGGSTTTSSLSLDASNGSRVGWVYANSSGQGFLTTGGSWRFQIPASGSLQRDATYTIWDSGNDGSGSGLDADLLDGQQASAFLGVSAKAADSNLLDGIDSSRFIYGDGITGKSTYVSSFQGQPSGFFFYSAATGAPTAEWYNWITCRGNSWGNGGEYSFQLANSFWNKKLYFQHVQTGGYQGWDEIWTSATDGSGSGLDADLLDGHQGDTYVGKFGNAYYQANTWIQLTGEHGLYAPTVNGAHFYPNNSGYYGTWKIVGARGGYTGIYLDNGGGVVTGMYDSSGNGGDYASAATGGWHYYYHRGNRCMGVGDSTTSSSYGLYEQAGGIYSTGNITAYSDRRVKENIRTIDNALETVEQMRGVYYNRIDDEEKKTVIGFIAQEIDEIEGAKPLVTYAEDVDQYGVSYGNTTALLVEAIKELSQQVKELQQEIKELKNA